MSETTTVLMNEFVTHDVRRFILAKPEGFEYQPGQGVEVALDEPDWRGEGRPFTPTSLPGDGVLELTVKIYPGHDGVTARMGALQAGDRLLLSDVFGTITYQGPGVFLAGGAGVTPFLSILRRLQRQGDLEGCSLLFSNKTPADVICEKELRHALGERCILTCTRASTPGYESRRMDRDFLAEKIRDFDQRFYVCGPPAFVDDIKAALEELGASAEALVFEE